MLTLRLCSLSASCRDPESWECGCPQSSLLIRLQVQVLWPRPARVSWHVLQEQPHLLPILLISIQGRVVC